MKLQKLAYMRMLPQNGGIVLDVSEGGLGFQLANPVEPGTEIVGFTFSLRNRGKFEGTGVIVWTDPSKKKGGLRFISLPQHAREELFKLAQADTASEQDAEAPVTDSMTDPTAEDEGWPDLMGKHGAGDVQRVPETAPNEGDSSLSGEGASSTGGNAASTPGAGTTSTPHADAPAPANNTVAAPEPTSPPEEYRPAPARWNRNSLARPYAVPPRRSDDDARPEQSAPMAASSSISPVAQSPAIPNAAQPPVAPDVQNITTASRLSAGRVAPPLPADLPLLSPLPPLHKSAPALTQPTKSSAPSTPASTRPVVVTPIAETPVVPPLPPSATSAAPPPLSTPGRWPGSAYPLGANASSPSLGVGRVRSDAYFSATQSAEPPRRSGTFFLGVLTGVIVAVVLAFVAARQLSPQLRETSDAQLASLYQRAHDFVSGIAGSSDAPAAPAPSDSASSTPPAGSDAGSTTAPASNATQGAAPTQNETSPQEAASTPPQPPTPAPAATPPPAESLQQALTDHSAATLPANAEVPPPAEQAPAKRRPAPAETARKAPRKAPANAGGDADAPEEDGGTGELASAQKYLNGDGVPRNTAVAARLLWESVADGNTRASILLADLYRNGIGVQKSCEQARVLLQAAAEKGSPEAAQKFHDLVAGGCR